MLKTGNGYQSIGGVAVAMNTSRDGRRFIPFYSGSTRRTIAYLIGPAAPVRLTDKKPTFYSRIEPTRLRLLHLGIKDDRRYVVASNSDREIQIQGEQVEHGIYRIAPTNDLEAGEYAFLAVNADQQGPRSDLLLVLAGGGMASEAYDFAIDTGPSAATEPTAASR